MAATTLPLRQRADYTHKNNTRTGRHGWLRLTPAYSVKIVDELIDPLDRPVRIFDPFCGTATTALSAAYRGHHGVTADINPFLVWLGRAKTACYSSHDISETRHACVQVLALVSRDDCPLAPIPPLHNIERWWSPQALRFLCALKSALETITQPGSPPRTLLEVAFCRTLIANSNAAFNHQSMSFKDVQQLCFGMEMDMSADYAADVEFVLEGARENPIGSASVILGDSRDSARTTDGIFDHVITSPPYVNRMSYIRELRPYMYWLGWLNCGREAGELDWSAIGGTWGIATSRLADWTSQNSAFASPSLAIALDRIAHADNKNGALLANYVAKYFDDMWAHFSGLTAILAPGAELHYIVGNSTFYGVLLHVEQLYADMLCQLGFIHVSCRPIRKRNSKKELIEFDVVAVWPS